MDHHDFVHPTVEVLPKAVIGENTNIWQHCQVYEARCLDIIAF